MGKDAGDWEPVPGEKVRILIYNPDCVDYRVPDMTWGIVVRKHGKTEEPYPYEVDCGLEYGKFMYALDDLFRMDDDD